MAQNTHHCSTYRDIYLILLVWEHVSKSTLKHAVLNHESNTLSYPSGVCDTADDEIPMYADVRLFATLCIPPTCPMWGCKRVASRKSSWLPYSCLSRSRPRESDESQKA